MERRTLSGLGLAAWLLVAGLSRAAGQENTAPPLLVPPTAIPAVDSAGHAPETFTPSDEFQEWITRLVRENLPHDYEKKKNWGNTARTFDGVSVRVEDGRVKTHRKYKEANDGLWQHYQINLKNPEEKFEIRVANLHEAEGGRMAMDLVVLANLEVFARQARWERGLQLYSLSAEADARVRLSARVLVASRLDVTRLPPDVILDPEVTEARLDIPEFRLRRISKANGPVVRSLSHTVREALEDKLREDNEKLVATLNKQIARQEKKLRLSLADMLNSKLGALLPKEP